MTELSNQMRQERFYITDSVSRVNATLDMYADKVELMEAVIFEHNKLLDRLDVEMLTTDDDGNPIGCGMDLLDWQAHLQTELGLSRLKLRAAHYQIKRAIAQLSEPLVKTPVDDIEVKLTVMSVVAQLTMYLEGE